VNTVVTVLTSARRARRLAKFLSSHFGLLPFLAIPDADPDDPLQSPRQNRVVPTTDPGQRPAVVNPVDPSPI